MLMMRKVKMIFIFVDLDDDSNDGDERKKKGGVPSKGTQSTAGGQSLLLLSH